MHKESVIRKIRQKIFSYSEEKQEKATKLITKIKSKINYQTNNNYHPFYAAE